MVPDMLRLAPGVTTHSSRDFSVTFYDSAKKYLVSGETPPCIGLFWVGFALVSGSLLDLPHVPRQDVSCKTPPEVSPKL